MQKNKKKILNIKLNYLFKALFLLYKQFKFIIFYKYYYNYDYYCSSYEILNLSFLEYFKNY